MIRQGYLPVDNPTFDQLCRKADTGLFTVVLNNPGHVLHKLLPPGKSTTYSAGQAIRNTYKNHEKTLKLAIIMLIFSHNTLEEQLKVAYKIKLCLLSLVNDFLSSKFFYTL